MKCFSLIIFFGFFQSTIICQDFSSSEFQLKIDNSSHEKVDLSNRSIMQNTTVSKFKKNRKNINNTALILLGLGVSLGAIETISCNRDAIPGLVGRCQEGIVVGTVLGVTTALGILLIGHPINRIKNKGKDLSNINVFDDTSNFIVSYGVMNGGLGVTLSF